MVNYPVFMNSAMAVGFLETMEGKSFFSDLDESTREEVQKHSKEFQSKEEVERFIYHLDHPDSIK